MSEPLKTVALFKLLRACRPLRSIGLYLGVERERLDCPPRPDGWEIFVPGRAFLTFKAGQRRVLKINLPWLDKTSIGAA